MERKVVKMPVNDVVVGPIFGFDKQLKECHEERRKKGKRFTLSEPRGAGPGYKTPEGCF
jgi:hypothetical protein